MKVLQIILSLMFGITYYVSGREVRVGDVNGFTEAVNQAKAGDVILLEAGEYEGAVWIRDVHGEAGRPIVIAGADPNDRPVIVGRNECVHMSGSSYVELRDLELKGAKDNGLNIDDGGGFGKAHHITVRRVKVSDIGPKGNRDGIKLSGLVDFVIEDCELVDLSDGGSGIDMVGCHNGQIKGCRFKNGGASGVQAKGGSGDVAVVGCWFEDYGQRGVNIGGSTGLQFFRPELETVKKGQRCESRNITVEHCVFVRGVTPVAFVGADHGVVRRNTIVRPERWALRILQENRAEGFMACQNGIFEKNVIVYTSDIPSKGVNVGDGTRAETFRFVGNVWYCEDRPGRALPVMPAEEVGRVIAVEPVLVGPDMGDMRVMDRDELDGCGAAEKYVRKFLEPRIHAD